MKPSSAALRALLASRQFFAADLFTFSGGLLGTPLRYCGGDMDLVANGITYRAGGTTGPYFDRSGAKAKCHWKIGTSVDTLVFDVLPGSSTVLGESFLAACHAGLFDGAELTLERAFMPSYGATAAGTVIMFVGRVGQIDIGRSIATFTISSHLELLNLQMPRNLYQAGCVNNLGDAACTVDLALYAQSLTAAGGSTASVIAAAVTNPLAGYFDQGKVKFTGGANTGLSRSIRSCSFGAPGSIALLAPLPEAPASGDAFTIFPGCDKSQAGANGCPKFANQPNFKATPFVPLAETAV